MSDEVKLDLDLCFLYAGYVTGFSLAKDCPEDRRADFRTAGDQFRLLAFEHRRLLLIQKETPNGQAE